MFKKFLFSFFVATFAASTVAMADPVNLISASRYVTVTASASGSGTTETNMDSTTATAFDPFHGMVSQTAMKPDPAAGINFAMGSASQNSSISTNSFSISQNIFFTAGQAIAMSPGSAANADSISFFQVSMSVTQLTALNIFVDRNILHGGEGYSDEFSLSSIDHGIQNLSPGTLSGSVSFEITLFPQDTYTLTAFEEAGSNFPDSFGQEGGSTTTLTASFMAVPETPTFWPVTILFIVGMVTAFLKRSASDKLTVMF
ncbi:MAG TPA: hypothetical protein VGM62_02115 [Chthoniobacterales bacterium]|jgi:hypothetical protein